MTYERLKIDDYQLLDVLEVADREGALVMVHAENNDMIRWIARRLVDRGMTAPKYHAVAHDPIAESEATHRAVALARLMDVPLLIVHVAGLEAVRVVHSSQALGLPILAESCPQYLFLTHDDLDRDGLEGAMYCCSPPPRDAASQQAVWAGLLDGTLQMYSSDHAPYRFDASGKIAQGDQTTFKDMANGVPGLELRMPLLFSEGVLTGRMTIERFVAVTSTNHARTYGLHPRKGTIAVGADADLAVWNPGGKSTSPQACCMTRWATRPTKGAPCSGWPEIVTSGGRIVVRDGTLHAARGSGRFLRRGTPEPVLRQRLNGNPNSIMRKVFAQGTD